MFRKLFVIGAVASASAFAPMLGPSERRSLSRGASDMKMQQVSTLESKARRPAEIAVGMPEPSKIEQLVSLKPNLFRQLDTDNSGTVTVDELKRIFREDMSHKWKEGVVDAEKMNAQIDALFTRADLDGNGELDIGEFERAFNMQTNGELAAGNAFAQTAIKLRLLSPNSPIADGEGSTMVGNKGFDPLGFATSNKTLKAYREAEVKHGRLAMLAALGWPISELMQPWLSRAFGAPDLLAISANGLLKAPSVLNGGLDKINPAFFMAIIIFTSTVESMQVTKIRTDDYVPGDLGFDPLKLYVGASADKKRDFELKELNNGRLAMLAIAGYAAQEFVANAPVAGWGVPE